MWTDEQINAWKKDCGTIRQIFTEYGLTEESVDFLIEDGVTNLGALPDWQSSGKEQAFINEIQQKTTTFEALRLTDVDQNELIVRSELYAKDMES